MKNAEGRGADIADLALIVAAVLLVWLLIDFATRIEALEVKACGDVRGCTVDAGREQ